MSYVSAAAASCAPPHRSHHCRPHPQVTRPFCSYSSTTPFGESTPCWHQRDICFQHSSAVHSTPFSQPACDRFLYSTHSGTPLLLCCQHISTQNRQSASFLRSGRHFHSSHSVLETVSRASLHTGAGGTTYSCHYVLRFKQGNSFRA